MVKILEKSRQINKLLQTMGKFVGFLEMAKVLGKVMYCNVYILNKKGKILGHNIIDDYIPDEIEEKVIENGSFPVEFNNELIKNKASKTNLNEEPDTLFASKNVLIVPIIGGGERLGTLVLNKDNEDFIDTDMFLAEYGSTIIGMEILRNKLEKVNKESRKRIAVIIALNALSYSERDAMDHIFEELAGEQGIIVASNVADKFGHTRSIIVNAMRKLESASIIETRSLGMKGTYIRVLNDYFLEEINKIEEEFNF